MSSPWYNRRTRRRLIFTKYHTLRTVDKNLLSWIHLFECLSPAWNNCMEILTHDEITSPIFPIVGHSIATMDCLSFLAMPNWPHCSIEIFNIMSPRSNMFSTRLFLHDCTRWFYSYHPKFFSTIYMARYFLRIFLFPLWFRSCPLKYIFRILVFLCFCLWWINRSSTHCTLLVRRLTKEF